MVEASQKQRLQLEKHSREEVTLEVGAVEGDAGCNQEKAQETAAGNKQIGEKNSRSPEIGETAQAIRGW